MPASYMDDLATIDVARISQNQTSYDRTGGNMDGTGFLYSDATGKVMLDAAGPGIVRSIWCTGFKPEDRMKVYFDGEATPRIDILVSDMFSGTYEGYKGQFRSPLVGNNFAYSGGFNCYVPLPFAKSIKISTNAEGMSYNQFRYDTYPAGTPIATWTEDQDNSAAARAWSNVTSDPKDGTSTSTIAKTIDLAAGGSAVLMDVAGPASVASIRMRIPNPDKDTLNNVRIRMTWDNAGEYAIDAPLGAFFGMGTLGRTPVRALPLGYDTDTNTLYMHFPMPFAARGKIELASSHTADTKRIWYEVRHKPFVGSFDNVGYLKGTYTVQSHGDDDHKDIIFLDVAGSGKLVGIVDSRTRNYGYYQGNPWMPAQYLEGDERIYVDGAQTPSWQGTGTEDFYNGGWYFIEGPYSRQPSGCTVKDDTNNGSTEGTFRTAMYRMLVEDAITFRNGIRFGMEHGFGWGTPVEGFHGDLAVTAEALVFYYHKPEAKMTLSDTLEIANASSEQSHNYAIKQQTWADSLSSTYEGADDQTTITDTGRAHKGSSEFAMAISAANQGVILRRRLDFATPNQSADVYVDGTLVGRWYNGGSNTTHRWRDSDYMISAAHTGGKSRITVSIECASAEAAWSEFRYQAYSL